LGYPALKVMNQLGQTFLIFAVGLAGGLVGSVLLSSPTNHVEDAATSAPGSSQQATNDYAKVLDGIQGDLAMLTDEVAQQRNMMRALDSRIASTQATRNDARLGAVGVELDPLAALNPSEIPSGQGFDAAVNAAIEKREADEAAVREAERAAQREERLNAQMENYIKELGLDANQAAEMKTILNDATVARTAFFNEMRESGSMDRELMREKMTELSDTQNEALGNVLNPTQMGQYTEMSANSGFGGGRRTGGTGGGARTNEF
jgi:hypothetical protein